MKAVCGSLPREGWRRHKRQRGWSARIEAFSLVELLVVIAVLSALMAILLPALNAARERGRRTVCLANLHSIGQTIVLYAHDNDGVLIPGDCQTPWAVWGKPTEPCSSDDTSCRAVNLGHLLSLGLLPIPTDKSTVLFCPSTRIGYGIVPPGELPSNWGSGRAAAITYMFNEALDGFTEGAVSGKQAALTHKDVINFLRADGSAAAVRFGALVYDAHAGAESLSEVVTRYQMCFPTSMVFRWLDRGSIDMTEARNYLNDPVRWYEGKVSSPKAKSVSLASVGSSALVSDMVGYPAMEHG